MGLISSIALFLPVFFILVLRLGAYKTFPALLIYYFIVFVYNLFTQGYIKADPELIRSWGLANNLLDMPLLLTFLIYFSSSPVLTQRMKSVIYAFMAFEAAVVAIIGFNVNAITIILGPGIAISIGFCLIFFIRQTKITITYKKALGKALIAASLLFAYGCYGIIYLMYYIFKFKQVDDIFLIYFLVVTFSSFLVSAGIVIEQKRIRKLNELKTTRRELSDMYSEEKQMIPASKVAIIDFDREQWS